MTKDIAEIGVPRPKSNPAALRCPTPPAIRYAKIQDQPRTRIDADTSCAAV